MRPWAAVVADDQAAIEREFAGATLQDAYPYDGGVVGLLQPGEQFPLLPETISDEKLGIHFIGVGDDENIVRSLAKNLAERTDIRSGR